MCDWMLNQCLRIRAAHNALRYATRRGSARHASDCAPRQLSRATRERKPIGRHCTDHRADRRHPCGLFCWLSGERSLL